MLLENVVGLVGVYRCKGEKSPIKFRIFGCRVFDIRLGGHFASYLQLQPANRVWRFANLLCQSKQDCPLVVHGLIIWYARYSSDVPFKISGFDNKKM